MAATKVQVKQLQAVTTVANPGLDTTIPTEKAVRSAINAIIAAADALVYKGTIDCSGNPNYPAADAGHLYIVSVAGKVGGASGIVVDVGDWCLCNTDGTASGDQATVGTKWNIVEKNMVAPLALALGGTGADLSAAQNGQVYKNGAVLATRLDNLAASNDPATANDSTQNYSVGSRWINTSTKAEWVCLDAATSAARWHKTSAAMSFPNQVFTRFISPMLEALTWAAAQIYQAAVTFQSTIAQAVTSSGAGSTFNQSGTGDIAAFQDASVSTVRIPDQGGVALVPQAGGFQAISGLLGYDNVIKRLVLYHETHNYPVPIDPRNGFRQARFDITYV